MDPSNVILTTFPLADIFHPVFHQFLLRNYLAVRHLTLGGGFYLSSHPIQNQYENLWWDITLESVDRAHLPLCFALFVDYGEHCPRVFDSPL